MVDVKKYEQELRSENEDQWIAKGQKKALALFHEMAERVPAYKDFLKKSNISPADIHTIEDFKKIPPVDKNNYLRQYPLKDLCWDGKFDTTQWVVSTTSGSTGEPFYFPRTKQQDEVYALTAELYLRNNFDIDKKTTLYIDGFAMGAWIGGLFTYQALKYVVENGNYPLSIITPGIFKTEIIKAIKNIGKQFDQIIIGGYPPMIKDMIDDAVTAGINWKEYNVGFIFSAEGFSEKFRDYVIKKTHLKNEFVSTLNHYGSVDLGTMAHETPLSIFLRRLIIKKPKLCKTVFNDIFRLPTFAQYNPTLFYFEEVNERLFCTSYSGLPLVRYDLKDHGGIYTLAQIKEKISSLGINLDEELKGKKLGRNIWNLPFVYVYERSDFIVKLYGANIYPESIKKALQHDKLINMLTGKFTMQVQLDKDHTQYLELTIEMKDGVKETTNLEKLTRDIIVKRLLKENSEYRSNYKESSARQMPRLIFKEYENNDFFRPGVKQKWVNKK